MESENLRNMISIKRFIVAQRCKINDETRLNKLIEIETQVDDYFIMEQKRLLHKAFKKCRSDLIINGVNLEDAKDFDWFLKYATRQLKYSYYELPNMCASFDEDLENIGLCFKFETETEIEMYDKKTMEYFEKNAKLDLPPKLLDSDSEM